MSARRWTAEEAEAAQSRIAQSRARGAEIVTKVTMGVVSSPKPAKYRNQPVVIDGKRFASKLEGRCYEELKLRQKLGDVSWFIRQPRFELAGVRYYADFLAVLNNGKVEVIDAKGRDTPASRNKRKQVKEMYGVEVILWPRK